jgi:hypothetical protein
MVWRSAAWKLGVATSTRRGSASSSASQTRTSRSRARVDQRRSPARWMNRTTWTSMPSWVVTPSLMMRTAPPNRSSARAAATGGRRPIGRRSQLPSSRRQQSVSSLS